MLHVLQLEIGTWCCLMYYRTCTGPQNSSVDWGICAMLCNGKQGSLVSVDMTPLSCPYRHASEAFLHIGPDGLQVPFWLGKDRPCSTSGNGNRREVFYRAAEECGLQWSRHSGCATKTHPAACAGGDATGVHPAAVGLGSLSGSVPQLQVDYQTALPSSAALPCLPMCLTAFLSDIRNDTRLGKCPWGCCQSVAW